jgi:hypothetical protein
MELRPKSSKEKETSGFLNERILNANIEKTAGNCLLPLDFDGWITEIIVEQVDRAQKSGELTDVDNFWRARSLQPRLRRQDTPIIFKNRRDWRPEPFPFSPPEGECSGPYA